MPNSVDGGMPHHRIASMAVVNSRMKTAAFAEANDAPDPTEEQSKRRSRRKARSSGHKSDKWTVDGSGKVQISSTSDGHKTVTNWKALKLGLLSKRRSFRDELGNAGGSTGSTMISMVLGSFANADNFVHEAIHYMIFFVLFSVAVFGRLNQSTPAFQREKLEHEFLPRQSVEYRLKDDLPLGREPSRISYEPWFHQVSSTHQVLDFLNNSFLNYMVPQEHDFVSGDNQQVLVHLYQGDHLLGDVRILQKRHASIPCSGISIESKASQVSRGNTTCVDNAWKGGQSFESFGGPNGDTYVWTEDPNDDINSMLPKPLSHFGGGGFSVYLPAPHDKASWSAIVQALRENHFIDSQTGAILIEFALYNANVNLMSTVTLLFTVPAYGGLIEPSSFIRIADPFNYQSTGDIIITCVEVAVMLYWIKFVVQACLVIRSEGIKKYLGVVWNNVELMNLLILGVVMLGRVTIDVAAAKLLQLQASGDTRYVNWIPLLYSESVCRNLQAFNAVLIWIKVLKFARISPRLAMLEMVLRIAMQNLFAFMVLFTIVYVGFVQAFYMVFHVAVDEYSSVPHAFYSLFSGILGQIDFDSLQDENWLLGPLLYLMFAVIIFFVLLNLLLSILREAYATMRRQMRASQKEMDQKLADAKQALGQMNAGVRRRISAIVTTPRPLSPRRNRGDLSVSSRGSFSTEMSAPFRKAFQTPSDQKVPNPLDRNGSSSSFSSQATTDAVLASVPTESAPVMITTDDTEAAPIIDNTAVGQMQNKQQHNKMRYTLDLGAIEQAGPNINKPLRPLPLQYSDDNMLVSPGDRIRFRAVRSRMDFPMSPHSVRSSQRSQARSDVSSLEATIHEELNSVVGSDVSSGFVGGDDADVDAEDGGSGADSSAHDMSTTDQDA